MDRGSSERGGRGTRARSGGFRCTECERPSAQWSGRCSGCGGWNTLVETVETDAARASVGGPVPIGEVVSGSAVVSPIGIGELDRVLGGGLVAGSVTLIGGEPGIGKSTLLLQAAGALAAGGRRVLYLTAEESDVQVTERARRLGIASDGVWLQAAGDIEQLDGWVSDVDADVVVVDSIQTVGVDGAGAPGSPTQVRECAWRLVEMAKTRGVSVLLVGQVTKDGDLAGPRALEHVVDTVLSFEGDRHQGLRVLRAVKHRFGPTGELGVFDMGERGLDAVDDPSALFLADRVTGVPGTVVVPTVAGDRPLLVEVQALVAGRELVHPRRTAQGLDSARLSMLTAVLGEHGPVAVAGSDVHASAVGGVRVAEPAADLGVLLALAGAATHRAVPADCVACGEVGLVGEVRRVGDMARRLTEAARLGFRRAVVPASTTSAPPGLELITVTQVAEACRRVLRPSA